MKFIEVRKSNSALETTFVPVTRILYIEFDESIGFRAHLEPELAALEIETVVENPEFVSLNLPGGQG